MADAVAAGPSKLEKKPVKFSNLLCRRRTSTLAEDVTNMLAHPVGAGLNMFE